MRTFRRTIVLHGALKDSVMPAWNDSLHPAGARAIQSYLIAKAHKAHAANPALR